MRLNQPICSGGSAYSTKKSGSERRGSISILTGGNSSPRTRCCARCWHSTLIVPHLIGSLSSDAEGKPRIDPGNGAGECPFSLSHTRGLVAAALSANGALGIDVEHIDPRKADFAMAEEYFAPAEVRLLQAAPASERDLCFFRLWTLKEAYVKATGTGLSTPLKSFAFAFEPICIQFEPGSAERAAEWQFAILPTTDLHVLSVAAGHHTRAVRVSPCAVVPRNLSMP